MVKILFQNWVEFPHKHNQIRIFTVYRSQEDQLSDTSMKMMSVTGYSTKCYALHHLTSCAI